MNPAKAAQQKINDTQADIRQTWRMLPAALYLSWSDTKARYRRSVLGPLWLTLGTAIGVGGLSYVWGTLFKQDLAHFIPMLSIGLILWGFIAGLVIESTQAYISNASLIRNLQLPMLFPPTKLMMRHLINLAHNLIVIVIVFIIYPPQWTWSMLATLPALMLTLLNLFWMTVLIGMLAARFRDLETAVANFMPLLFFMSPVLFKAEQLGVANWILWLNPFSYFITSVRDPMMGINPPWFVLPTMLGMFIIGGTTTLYLFNRKRTEIPYWI